MSCVKLVEGVMWLKEKPGQISNILRAFRANL